MEIKKLKKSGPLVFLNQKGLTLVELMISLVMSGIVMAALFVIVSGSHTHVIKLRKKINLQQDVSLIGLVLGTNIRQGVYGRQEIYASYADYTGGGPTQSSGTCLKLYFPSGDSTVIYKENSGFKIQKSDLSITNLVPTVVDSLLFTQGTKSIKTYLALSQDTKTINATLVDAFRVGKAYEIVRPTGNGAFTEIDSSDCDNNWECVEDAIADDDLARNLERNGLWKTDTYTIDDLQQSGTIDSVVVYIRVREDDVGAEGRTALYTYSTTYYGSVVDLNGIINYMNVSTAYTTNPNTSAAWTWTEIDDLQIGVSLKKARCTQVWVRVYYTE